MKKKYSTLLNFALATCVAVSLAACGSDGDKTGSTGGTVSKPKINIGGKVYDSNNQPLANVRVSCQDKIVKTNELGDWKASGLMVTNVAGADEDTAHGAISCTVEGPAGYLGATVMVMPEAQLDGTTWPLEASGGENDVDIDCDVSNACKDATVTFSADGGDVTLHIVNPRTTFINGMYVEASTAYLPKKESRVCGVLRNCSTDEPLSGVNMKVDLDYESKGGPHTVANWGRHDNGVATYTTYTTPISSNETESDGSFCIDMLANDSDYFIMAEGMNSLQANSAEWCKDSSGDFVDGSWKENGNSCYTDIEIAPHGSDALEGLSFNTFVEGTVLLGDLCAENVTTGDIKDPCLVSVNGIVGSKVKVLSDDCAEGTPNPNCDDFEYGLLDDDLDGTAATGGIKINFTETMDASEIDALTDPLFNSIYVYNHSLPGYVDFTYAMSGKTLTINLDEALGDDDYITIWLAKTDFKDLAGNMLTYYRWSLSGHCPVYDDDLPFNDDYIDWEKSNAGNWYFTISLKRFSPDDIDPGEVSGLQQVCSASSGADAGLAELNADYPNTFYTSLVDDPGDFKNLNVDDDYEERLEALADAIGGDGSYLAKMWNNHTNVSFVTPSAGGYQVCTKDPGEATYSCGGTNSNTGGTVVEALDNVEVGTMVQINILDDLDNYSDVSDPITLDDCVAPTTVLNYAYNTCGHLSYSMEGLTDYHYDSDWEYGYDTNYFDHIVVGSDPFDLGWGVDNCAIGAEGGREDACGGGENCREGLAGALGIPTLNITCRLLKDYAAVPNSALEETTIWGLYEGTNAWDTVVYGDDDDGDYDATTWAAWRTTGFEDTIGVAFSENIALVDPIVQPVCAPDCNADVEIAGVMNNQAMGDDMDSGVDGHPSADSGYDGDFLMLNVDDVLTLANEDHLTIMNFDASVEDGAIEPNAADNANVQVNDLLPPFVVYAYWDGGIVIKFNEPIAVDTSDEGTDCNSPQGSTGNTDFISLRDFENGGWDRVYLNCATLSEGDTLLTIPGLAEGAANIGTDHFPVAGDDPSRVYAEPTIAAYTAKKTGDLEHGLLDWQFIRDANNGNYWAQWIDHRSGDYLDIEGDQQCNTPEFAIVDVVPTFEDNSEIISCDTDVLRVELGYNLAIDPCQSFGESQGCTFDAADILDDLVSSAGSTLAVTIVGTPNFGAGGTIVMDIECTDTSCEWQDGERLTFDLLTNTTWKLSNGDDTGNRIDGFTITPDVCDFLND